MLLEAKNLSFGYGGKSVLRSVSVQVASGERVGLVAPSGYGKTTLSKLLAGYQKPVSGEVLLDGKPLPIRGYHPVQLIYQHPEQAVNPRFPMWKVLEEAGQLSDAVMEAVGIQRHWLDRLPRELSGGELQRFCVARALGEGTRFLIADEISTMLDVITQAQLWHYLMQQAAERQLGLLVITHNLPLAQQVCTRIVRLEAVNGS